MKTTNCNHSTIFADGEFTEARRAGGLRVCVSTLRSHEYSVTAMLVSEFAMIQVIEQNTCDNLADALTHTSVGLLLAYIDANFGIINASIHDVDDLREMVEDLKEYFEV